jgi:hypothetical protein
MDGKKVKPMSDQPIEAGRSVDQLVDPAPELVAAMVDLRRRRHRGEQAIAVSYERCHG